jgi:hypothetical protein
MFYYSPIFWPTIYVLLGTAVYSILLSGLAKTAFVQVMRYPLAIATPVIWAVSIHYCLALIHTGWGLAMAIPGMFWASVFLLGAMVVLSQDLSMRDGKIHVTFGSPLYFILTKCARVDTSKQYTVCSLSWKGMFVLVGWPIVFLLLVFEWTFASLLLFLVIGENPVKSFRYLCGIGPNAEIKPMYIGPIPVLPILWTLIVLAVRWLIKFAPSPAGKHVGLLLAGIVVCLLIVAGIVWGIFALAERIFPSPYSDRGIAKAIRRSEGKPVMVREVLGRTGNAIKTPVVVLYQVAMSVWKKFCLPISFD